MNVLGNGLSLESTSPAVSSPFTLRGRRLLTELVMVPWTERFRAFGHDICREACSGSSDQALAAKGAVVSGQTGSASGGGGDDQGCAY